MQTTPSKTYDFSDWQLVELTGDVRQVVDFLQGQTTCDVTAIAEGNAQFTAFCNHKGRVLFSGWLLHSQQGFALAMPQDLVDKACAHIHKYGIFSQVSAEPADDMALYGYKDGNEENTSASASWSIALGRSDTLAIIPGDAPAQPVTLPWQSWFIEHCLAVVLPETSERFTPQMLGYMNIPSAVSLSKGCFVGQEVIARTHNLGTAKRQVQRLELAADHTLQIGEDIHNTDGTVLGQIVLAVPGSAAGGNNQACLVITAIDRGEKVE